MEEEGRLTFYADISSEGVHGHERYGLSLYCYENRKRVFSVSQKSWATALRLRAGCYWSKEFENLREQPWRQYCVDPRILTLHIVTGAIMLMANWTDKDLALVEKELNKDLRLPSNREAIKWLEDNGFHWERMINDTKNKRERSNYGWTYAYGEGEFKYVPSNFAALFDSVHNDWLKSEDYQARVNNR